ncbi:AmmeMemoRadiSam system protein B [Haloglycomyces albus]|uniref:AmmeMemoRadiSam system protein B n=1 Tax=Haloglycomyces albus TaxID=526067 RepID=UPI00046D63D1|nr:AmmeMemoRadiSam system protein B [Haloglycomyces albus]
MTNTSAVRPPAVSGMFYKSDPNGLRDEVDALLRSVSVSEERTSLAEAYIVPHAGLRFSGGVAAEVYARMARHVSEFSNVILLGPSHRYPLHGYAASPAPAWSTPLGDVRLRATDAAPTMAQPHLKEHSLEVQLPFLQSILPEGFTITPVAVGMSDPGDTATLIDRLVAERAEEGTVVLCSTDLSHYHDRDTAAELDGQTAEAIVALQPRRISMERACGIFALRGLLEWAAQRGLTARRLRLGSSADTFGTPDRVVGYSSFAFHSDR